MAEVGSAFLSIVPTTKGFASQLSSQVDPGMAAVGKSSGKRFGGSFAAGLKGPVLAAGIAVASAAAIKFIKGSVAEAREAQKVGALTTQVIKSTGGAANVTAKQVGSLSAAISKKTGIDDEAIQSGANMLLTFTNVRNEAGKGNDIFNQATQAVTDMGAALGKDAKSSAIQLGKALNDPVKGISALSRAGVQFTDEQKKQIKAMVEAGNVAGAQKVILNELSKEFGGAAAAQRTAGDSMRVAWGNLQETVGTLLLPVLDQLFAGLSVVFGFIADHKSVMIALGAVIGVILVAALVAAAQATWAFTVALLSNPIVWVIVAIIALVAAIVLIVKHWDLVKKKTGQAWDWIKSKLGAVWGWIKSKSAAIWQSVKDWIARKWDEIKTTVATKGEAVLKWFKDLPGKLASLFVRAHLWLIGVGEDIVRGIIKGIGNGFRWVRNKIVELGGNVIGWAREILHIGSPSKLMADEVGRWIPAGIAMGIDRNASQVRASMAGLTSDLAMTARVGAPQWRGDGATAPANRPIYTDSGVLLGWMREVANEQTRLVFNEQVFELGARA